MKRSWAFREDFVSQVELTFTLLCFEMSLCVVVCTWTGRRRVGLGLVWVGACVAWGLFGLGLVPSGRVFPWGDDPDPTRVPNPSSEREFPVLADVDAHPRGASPFGVEDMVGNVFQW
jgi:hypothetical protein